MRILTTALLVTICVAANARAQGLQTGVRGGINFSTTAASGAGEGGALDWHLRPVLGAFATWRLASWLELQPEALYAMKGAKDDEFVPATLLLDYLEVPLLARMTRGAPHATRYYVAAGPSIGLLLRAKTRAEFGSSVEEIDIKDDMEPLELGAVIAGGVELGSIVVDGRYTHGLSNIEKDSDSDQKMTNRTVSVTVGLKF